MTGRQRSYALFIGVYAVLGIILYAAVRLGDIPSSVCDGYFPYADAMAHGVFPCTGEVWAYGEWRSWEYPPSAYLFIFLPRLFASTAVGYQAAFIVMKGIFFTLGLWCSERLARVRGYNEFHAMALYSVMMFLMFEFLADRYDIIPAVLTLLTLVLVSERRSMWAFAVLAFAVTVKLYPAVFFPVLAIYLLARGRKTEAAAGTAVFIAVGLAVLALFYLCGADPLSFMNYHTDRPLEMESPAASVAEVASLLGLTDITYGFGFGSDNIYGPLPEFFAKILLPFMAVILILLYAHYAFWSVGKRAVGSRLEPDSALVVIIAVMTFILISTVFSGQYTVWLIPAVLFLYMIPGKGRSREFLLKAFILGEILTQLNFLVNFGFRGEGEAMSVLGVTVLLIRNAVMVILYLALTLELVDNDRGLPFGKKMWE